jgi:hypothetical protein
MAHGGRRVGTTPLVADTDAPSACCKLQTHRQIDSVALVQAPEILYYYKCIIVGGTACCSTVAVFFLQESTVAVVQRLLMCITVLFAAAFVGCNKKQPWLQVILISNFL